MVGSASTSSHGSHRFKVESSKRRVRLLKLDADFRLGTSLLWMSTIIVIHLYVFLTIHAFRRKWPITLDGCLMQGLLSRSSSPENIIVSPTSY